MQNNLKQKVLISKSLLEKVISYCNISEYNIIKELVGKSLNGTIALHPLLI